MLGPLPKTSARFRDLHRKHNGVSRKLDLGFWVLVPDSASRFLEANDVEVWVAARRKHYTLTVPLQSRRVIKFFNFRCIPPDAKDAVQARLVGTPGENRVSADRHSDRHCSQRLEWTGVSYSRLKAARCESQVREDRNECTVWPEYD